MGEIEAQLRRHAQVKDAVVLAREAISSETASGEKRLVAYVTCAVSGEVQVEDLRASLKAVLPEYMVPSAYVVLESLPLTANGKLDRKALPAPDLEAYGVKEYEPPQGEIETILGEIWQELLQVERVGRQDNFFELGGDSISSIRILAKARTAGLNISLVNLFRHPTIAQLARLSERDRTTDNHSSTNIARFELLSATERAQFSSAPDIEDAYPLTVLQAGMHSHSELSPDSAVYHDVFSYDIEGPFHRDLFARALQALVQRHPVLRTAFRMSADDRLLQVVEKIVEVPLQVTDVSHLSEVAQSEFIETDIEAEKRRRFIWSRAPLFRVLLHVRSPHRYHYTLSFHHSILDG